MRKNSNNYAFIDSQNLNLAIRNLGWKLDFKRFRVYLKEHYGVTKAYLFIGFIDGNNSLYTTLQEAGFLCVFKPTLTYKDGTTKGNVDAELVLQALLIPDRLRFSALLKFKFFHTYLRYMNDLQNKLEFKKKSPYKDETL